MILILLTSVEFDTVNLYKACFLLAILNDIAFDNVTLPDVNWDGDVNTHLMVWVDTQDGWAMPVKKVKNEVLHST